ncbi:Gfo/Idh/MocA family oxidoreductase [Halobacillus shinanisalinarum]|uniref:Gfo/Idh/MocA family oxidoreductase n=1 Tax=Halobacillus shinanisalinarum TaxID=2932258 RepID=A0ABY4GYW8_9BACI|nr:Gfo/Idh/MocA family oxidoreductase [Halobacillus shinanisalinarum]UOQ93308.1 Gfo/Idh/MocA family oxidoreductase [Halobacillus shinanisalinarum]
MEKVKVGVIGCGNISDIYFKNCSTGITIELVACSDLNKELAKHKATQYNIPLALPVNQLLTSPEIDLVINLTPPSVHAEISIQALKNDKHVYSEKPLAVNLEDGASIVKLAEEKQLLAGSAPDTFLGSGIQTCQQLIQKGEIGVPLAATAFMMKSGPEQWHTNPEFFYQVGGGPLFDMGPYYLTALIQLLGPINSVVASAKINSHERVIKTGEKQGRSINVETPTHYSGTLEFKNGPIATMSMSFDVAATDTPPMEIYGTEGTLKVPDPNTFGGPIFIKKKGEDNWREIELEYPYTENCRGLGVMDMISSIKYNTPFRANSQLAYHVLETMHAFHKSSNSGERATLQSHCKPSPLLVENSKLEPK